MPVWKVTKQWMRTMKVMKAMSVMDTYNIAADMVGLTPKQVKQIAETMMALAAKQVRSVGSIKIVGALNIKLKKKLAAAARKGVHPITKEPCVFKAREASQNLKITATSHFLLLIMYSDWVL